MTSLKIFARIPSALLAKRCFKLIGYIITFLWSWSKLSSPSSSTVSIVSGLVKPIKLNDLVVEVWGSIGRSKAAGELVEHDGWAVASRDVIATLWRLSFVLDILLFKPLVCLNRWRSIANVRLIFYSFIVGPWCWRWKDGSAIENEYARLRKDEYWVEHLHELSAIK